MNITGDPGSVSQPVPLHKTTYLRDAQAAVRIPGEAPYEFTPVNIQGESLSETIIRERRGEF